MAYIFFNFWAVALLMLIDQWRLTRKAQFFLLLFVLIVISFLPAFQYNVGSDYFSYVEIFSNHGKLDLYYRKNEFGFYYLVAPSGRIVGTT